MILLALGACTTPAPIESPGPAADSGDAGVEPLVPEVAIEGSRPDIHVEPAADVDVLIVGAGVAGLSAAIEAREAGATVLVLEREATGGGSARWAGGLMLFSGTSQQAELGVTDSAEQLLAEWPDFTGGDVDDPWVRFFAENNVALVYDWLAEMGVAWTAPQADPSAGTTLRIHPLAAGGAALAETLLDQLPTDLLRYETQADELLLDDAGRVVGVAWSDLATGETGVTTADAVIVATGGFMRDLDRVRQARPDLADRELSWGSWPGADGNGIDLVEAAGGTTENLQAVGLYAHGAPGIVDDFELRVDPIRALPWVNGVGERFCDESAVNDFRVGDLRAAQPGGDAWMIFDETTAALMSPSVNIPGGERYTLDDLADAGLLTSAEDLEGLAGSLGVDTDTFTSELAAFNAYAFGETETDTYRSDPGLVYPLHQSPYYALPVAITVAKGFGGVDVDLQGRVLDDGGDPVPGVYAAGELTGMAGGTLVGEYGFTGSLTAVTLGGRVAGQYAAAEALAR